MLTIFRAYNSRNAKTRAPHKEHYDAIMDWITKSRMTCPVMALAEVVAIGSTVGWTSPLPAGAAKVLHDLILLRSAVVSGGFTVGVGVDCSRNPQP